MMCVSMQATALELESAKLEDKVQVNKATLALNGAGVRSILLFKMYVAGLYLTEKRNTAEAVFGDKGEKRIALHVVVGDADSERFLNGFRKGIEKNHSEQELSLLRERMDALGHLFDGVKSVKKGDALTGSRERYQISINGSELGKIAGEDFTALLSIWIGAKPVSADLKKGLLGG
jgi:hypothetical protein